MNAEASKNNSLDTSPPAQQKRNRDATYYFTMITIQVEDCLFRVPRNGFEENSQVFCNMFDMPIGDDLPEQDGRNDDKPLLLEGVEKDAFKDFLWILYPPAQTETPAVKLSLKRWVAVLELANMWEFDKIRDLSIKKLQGFGMDAVTKITLTHKYEIRQWYQAGYLALAKREQPLTVEEATRLGFAFAVKMAQVREEKLQHRLSTSSSNGKKRIRMEVARRHGLAYNPDLTTKEYTLKEASCADKLEEDTLLIAIKKIFDV